MSDLVLTNQGVTTPTVTGSDLQGFANVTCMGSGRALSIFVETGGNHVYRSEDDGATWAELVSTGLPVGAGGVNAFSKMLPLSPDEVLVSGGFSGPDAIYRTTDGGETWLAMDVSAVFDGTDQGQISGFVNMGDDDILALGGFTSSGINGTDDYGYHVIRSEDGGLTWTGPISLPATPSEGPDGALFGATRGVYCGNDVVVVGSTYLPSITESSPRVYRSTDRGLTWTEIVLPTNITGFSSTFSVSDLAYLGNDIVLAAGYYKPDFIDPDDDRNIRLWRSIDAGLNWTETTDDIPSYLIHHTGDQVGNSLLQDLGNGYALLGFFVMSPFDNGGSNFRLTSDYGVTWTIPTTGPYTSDVHPIELHDTTVTDGGFALVTLKGSATLFPADTDNEIWRGVADGFTPVSVCICDTETPPPPPPPQEVGRSIICVPLVKGCEGPDVADPSVTVTTLGPGGFMAPLFFMGMEAGSGVIGVVTQPGITPTTTPGFNAPMFILGLGNGRAIANSGFACQTLVPSYCNAPSS